MKLWGDAMPPAMHETVPERVRSIISSPERLNNLTSGCPEIGIRLVSTLYPDMRDVWARVYQHKDAEFPTFFFCCAVELPARWRGMSKIPTTVLQRTILEIVTAAEELAALLEKHQNEITFHRGRLASEKVLSTLVPSVVRISSV